ncbi:hypothetical protein ASC95_11175 [Pelomonas sp. Root1217]|uniref:GTPase-associated system all-helical protein GASH n=1 Tax=Pelomonas sp. Root1217 TaxID=1736430 RepID=UPI00070F64AA|nr:GTPase-associated system all-helical protein GASH [Pelomonas sp. Root1217]KQV53302.1 hypothetical protein ASC95_11175 [Pelomonas sp. Root1217]
MINLALHLRITGMQVLDGDVNSRKAAAADLQAKWLKENALATIFQRAHNIATALGTDGDPPHDLAVEVEKAVQDHASAFLSSERPLEVGICAAAAIDAMLEGSRLDSDGWTVVDVLATALWSALSFQTPLLDAKREALRLEVLELVQQRSMEAAEESRERTEVADFGDFAVVDGDDAKTLTAFKRATGSTIKALRRNAALDREELDFMWWTLVARSRLLDRPLSKLVEPVRLVVAGIEAADYLRRLPCDVHRDLVLRHADEDTEATLSVLLAALGDDAATVRDSLAEHDEAILATPGVFPLLSALLTGKAHHHGGDGPRSCSDWGARALLETSLLTSGPSTL